MKETRGWLFVVGILVILAWVGFSLVNIVKNTTENALAPINNVADSLETQIAQVLHPTPTIIPDPITVIREVRTLARLETVQYSVEKVITAETGQSVFKLFFGDKLLFIAHGVVIAGIDLSKIEEQDIWVNGGVLFVRLPQAEIFIVTLDNDKSYVYDRQTGLLTKGDIHLETAARKVAEDEIEKAAIEDGIVDTAQVNAEQYLYRLIRSLGFVDVVFVPTEEPK
ncbi:MAG TPA: DUF4230 domain-containing protein [Anaerolineae bacterium]|nr:DUF4230 domain-containing protein [Anaerolineae bacterium]